MKSIQLQLVRFKPPIQQHAFYSVNKWRCRYYEVYWKQSLSAAKLCANEAG